MRSSHLPSLYEACGRVNRARALRDAARDNTARARRAERLADDEMQEADAQLFAALERTIQEAGE